MQNIGTTLTPGLATPFQQRGTVLQILSSGNSAGLTVQFLKGSQVAYTVNNVLSGWKLQPQGGFDSITIESATADTISAIVTGGDVDIQLLSEASTIVNTAANPVPVNVTGGNITVTATNVGINNTSANPVPVSLVSEPGAPVPVSGTVALSGTSTVAGTVSVGNTNAAPVPVVDAYQAPVSAAWTSATALNTALTLNTQGYDTVIFTIAPSGTLTGGAITFECFDGTNWISLKAPRTDSYLTDTTFALSGAALHSWQLPVAGYPQVRARLSTVIAGSGTASLVAIASSAPDVSLVTVGLDPNQPLPAGTNNLGTVGLAAGTNNIGVITDNTQQARSLAGNAFCGACGPAAVASQYSRAQLWNPAGSGVNLYVEQVAMVCNAGVAGWLTKSTVALASNQEAGQNKLLSGASGHGQVNYDSTATVPAYPALGFVNSGSAALAQYPQAEPIIIPPGYGLTITCAIVNQAITGIFEWYEQ
jgi:hypothetical protein